MHHQNSYNGICFIMEVSSFYHSTKKEKKQHKPKISKHINQSTKQDTKIKTHIMGFLFDFIIRQKNTKIIFFAYIPQRDL